MGARNSYDTLPYHTRRYYTPYKPYHNNVPNFFFFLILWMPCLSHYNPMGARDKPRPKHLQTYSPLAQNPPKSPGSINSRSMLFAKLNQSTVLNDDRTVSVFVGTYNTTAVNSYSNLALLKLKSAFCWFLMLTDPGKLYFRYITIKLQKFRFS